MDESEKAAYLARRTDELYEKMLQTQAISKKRAADIIMDLIVRNNSVLNYLLINKSFLQ